MVLHEQEKSMQILGCPTQPPLLTKRVSPWMKRSLSPQHSTAIQAPGDPLHIQPHRRTTELHARAKGFGEAVTASDRKIIQDDESKNSSSGGDGDDEIPEEVFNRIIVRILFFVGTPMTLGVASLYLLSTLKEQHIWDVPMWVPYLTIVFGFGTSALGIAYGTLSTSWEPESKGSLLGWEQAQKNWPELWREEDERKR